MKKLKFYHSWLYVFIWMGVINYYSAQPGNVSSNTSSTLLNVILEPIETLLPSFYAIIRSYPLESYLRNLAHILVFFILGLLILNAAFKTHLKRPYLISFVIGFSYALLDEFFQSFIPGRASEWGDVFLDSLGILLSLTMIYLTLLIRSSVRDSSLNKNNLNQIK